jgi:membrane-bound lytic murein transglycosylase D
MILAAIIIARNPAQYGFDFTQEVAPTFDKVMLSRPVDLRRIAEWAGSTIDAIQALNPELRRWTTPVRESGYELKVPAGTAETINARLNEEDATDLASLNWYVAKRGETLATIARKLRVSRADLAEANYLRGNATLSAGQKLVVPREATALMAARSERTVPPAQARATVSEEGQLAPATMASNRTKVIYQVKQGDTLASIARVFKTTVASIRTWNKLPGNAIVAGQRLSIYAAAAD